MVPAGWLKLVYAALGMAVALNGLWMLLAPAPWFMRAPGVAHTGSFNAHLVRDFGACYLLVGLLILGSLARGSLTPTVHLWVTLFAIMHAAIHAGEILSGQLSAEHWRVDFPGVFLPALLLLVCSHPFAWKARGD